MRILIPVIAFAAAAAVVLLLLLLPGGEPPPAFVGTAACIECHEEETDAWRGSDHDRAMDHATDATVLGDFNDREATFHGITSRFFRKDGKFFAHTDGPDGNMQDFEITHVFGFRPLQQYLVPFPGGRYQVLSISWDTEKKEWIHLYADDLEGHGDPLHWTRPLQNWNHMCADCHSTDVFKNYDIEKDVFDTCWVDMNVGCEACHGPGSRHVRLAEAEALGEGPGMESQGLPDLTHQDVQIDVCARCHSRRGVLYPGYRAGGSFHDHFIPEGIDGPLYHPDGQVNDENYVYGSFLQSRMHFKNIRCTDCHDAHSNRRRKEGNDLCTRCHQKDVYDRYEHHFHPPGEGTLCSRCHMPEDTFMTVDVRSDHSLRVPRPDLTLAVGVPNTCNQCHPEESVVWARDWIEQWYGPERNRRYEFARAFAAARRGSLDALPELEKTFRNPELGPVIRSSALSLMGRFPTGATRRASQEGLRDDHPLVRLRAAGNYENLSGAESDLLPALHDPRRTVRMEAARILAGTDDGNWPEEDRKAREDALAEYEEGMKAEGDRASARFNLGYLYERTDRQEDAEREYRAALERDPAFLPAGNNLVLLLDRSGRKKEAEQTLRDLIRNMEERPGGFSSLERSIFANTFYSLGLLVAEMPDRLKEAESLIARAATLHPIRPRIHFNLGMLRLQLGRPGEGERSLRTALSLAPDLHEARHRLIIHLAENNRKDEARREMDELIKRDPQNPQWPRIRESLGK